MKKQQPPSQVQLNVDQSENENNTNSSPSQILERVQPDRVTVTKPEEDRRRRTIIVEKKNGSFGFTLQSYGIHYKKEHEIEMITYVDYVEYDGPAYKAGMREGDVILSINGSDMEKADHKTLVNFIKNCDTRMRMVVLFEDCVRKVELHMRYIQLQKILQTKMNELEKLCLRERQLLEGKWKTHSLPARKNRSAQGTKTTEEIDEESIKNNSANYSYCRPTVSSEDVAAKSSHKHQQHQQQHQQQPTFIFAYQYFDPHYRYMLQPNTSKSGEYLLTFEQPRYKGDQHHFVVKTPSSAAGDHSRQRKAAGSQNGSTKKKSSEHSYAGNLCNPCLQANSNNSGDNTSLEAYDLASPCCDPHCVPTSRRRSRHKKRDSKSEETQTEPTSAATTTTTIRPYSTSSQTQTMPRRYMQFGAGLVSQCSLHSCTSSELTAPTNGETTSCYTTSLSSDTLYWDGSEMNFGKSSAKPGATSVNNYNSQEPVYVQYSHVKPKSWDNLATKGFGGYGFGYGYVDNSKNYKTHYHQYVRAHSIDTKPVCKQSGQQMFCSRKHHNGSSQTKSTDNLLLAAPKYESNSSASIESSDAMPTAHETAEGRFFQSPRQSVISPKDPHFGYYSARKSQSQQTGQKTITSDATRL